MLSQHKEFAMSDSPRSDLVRAKQFDTSRCLKVAAYVARAGFEVSPMAAMWGAAGTLAGFAIGHWFDKGLDAGPDEQ